MITTSRVSLSAPHELLSFVPALVGFRPVESLVFVAFRDQSTCGAMRLDLKAFTDADSVDAAVDAALDTVTRIPRITGLLPVIYTDACFDTEGRIPHEGLASALSPHIENRGLDVVDILCVAADAWGGYLDESCLGHDLALLAQPDEVGGGHVLDAAEELRLPEVAPKAREIFAQAKTAIVGDDVENPDADTTDRGNTVEKPDAEAMTDAEESRSYGSAEFTAALASYVDDGADVLDAELALIAHLISEPPLRDVIAYSWAWGPETGRHLWHRIFTPEQFTTASDDDPWMYAFAGRIEVRPDAQRLRNAIRLLKRLCALQKPDDRAPALTLISWCYWALGLSSFSGAWQRDAIEVDGTYGLAIIMRMILDVGTIPDWAFYDPTELYDGVNDDVEPDVADSTC